MHAFRGEQGGVGCADRGEDRRAGAALWLAAISGASAVGAALIYLWRAGLLRGDGLPEIAGRSGEIRRSRAVLTGEDMVGWMNEMGVKLALGA